MITGLDSVLIIADIEGSSGCWSYRASAFKTNEWVEACVEMTRDVAAVVRALFDNGVHRVIVKDFHRTGFNLLPEMIDSRARVVQGYKIGPVPGIGDPGSAEAVLFLGMHAASGSNGFMAHTLTSRIRRLEVNGELLPEVYLFAGSLAPYGVRPIFFSGCPVACDQARTTIPGIHTYSIDKSVGRQEFAAAALASGAGPGSNFSASRRANRPVRSPGTFSHKGHSEGRGARGTKTGCPLGVSPTGGRYHSAQRSPWRSLSRPDPHLLPDPDGRTGAAAGRGGVQSERARRPGMAAATGSETRNKGIGRYTEWHGESLSDKSSHQSSCIRFESTH